MCGIVGSITNNLHSNSLISKLHNIQKHRGPDGIGEYISVLPSKRVVTLLHQRLSIIDLTDGSQPMSDLHKDITIIFNGEIFNHLELRERLMRKGYEFSTNHSDTEVLLYLYKEYKEKMLTYLNGMFAFVIYDRRNNLLFGARDRTGIKPLYFSNKNEEFYFASELKTLLKFGLKKDVDIQSLSNYLSFQFVPAPRTIFKDILKLEAGHFFIYVINQDTLMTEKYWDLTFSEKITDTNQAISKIKEQFFKSVDLWSLSDVEVGVSLSGGLDSSAIVAIYSKLSEKRIKTYTLGFEGKLKKLDERGYASLVSKKYNTEHHEFILTENKLLNELKDMVYHLDEPYGGGLPSWYIYKMMKGDVKVAMTGSGADELFGNYNKSLVYSSHFRKIKKLLVSGRKDCIDTIKSYTNYPRGFFYHRYFKGHEIDKILLNKKSIHPEGVLEDLISRSNQGDFRNVVPYVDFKMQLPEEFLNVTDKFSMAHSIEARVPFLDPDMIDLVMNIDPSIRMRYNDPKYLLKESIKEFIPNELLRKPKTGFVIPEAEWIRTILREKVEYLLGERYLLEQGIFDKNIYKDIVLPHMKNNKNNHCKIWTLLMFQLWYEEFI
jgi:asparagine synthase (glutamine-hydrolysing)